MARSPSAELEVVDRMMDELTQLRERLVHRGGVAAYDASHRTEDVKKQLAILRSDIERIRQ